MIINLIKRLFSKPASRGSKDPKDYTKCDLSTEWKCDDIYCKVCNKSTSPNEYMSDICNGCGNFNTQIRYGRSYRKIYIDNAWKYQVRYRNGNEEIRETWY